MPCRRYNRDRLILARRLLVAAILLTAVSFSITIVAIVIPERRATRQSAALTKFLNLSVPALVPSGRTLRHPETILPGIDRRFSPWLPNLESGAEELLLSRPIPGE